ncbi:MAG: hypothetical protein LBH19_15735 [Dysgonamonadaceae bacterium]|jgi:hypothetical protein|nr:hypothetical protein [Dysgonamonadaceae bacterium]
MENETTKTTEQDLKSALDSLKAAVKAARGSRDDKTRVLTEYIMEEVLAIQEELMELFAEYGATLTPTERSRLISAGIKNYGFIQMVYNSATTNPAFVPNYLDMAKFEEAITDMNYRRQLLSLVQQFAQTVSDSLLVDSDTAYRYALEYYNYVKEAARQKVPGAETEYNLLKPYFKRSKSTREGDEPTVMQLERDVRSLLHGTKEGKIVIENENPDVSGGKRFVSDAVHSEHEAVKETTGVEAKA